MPLDAVLRESEGRYRALVDLVPDAVLAMRADRIVYVNKEAASLFRGSEEKLLEQKPDALMPLGEAGPIFQKARESLLQGRVARYEGDARTLKGTVVPVEARFSRIEWQGETAVLMAVRDVTERRRIEASMRESERRYRTLFGELSRSNRDLEQFASVSSHDLKEPLRMVTAFLSLLKERLEGCLDAQSEEYIRIAMTSATRMQALIDDLLVYSCVGREASAKAVSAAEAAALAVRNLEAVIQDSGAVIRVKALPAVKANAGELTQVFQNLISNAIKFRGLRSPDINVGVVRDGAFWRFSVRDNGIGIDPAYQDRLFKIFNRLHTPDEYPGTGVGLAVCKKIIERQGGRIWVESEPGTGATFHFTFPAMEPLP
jgi:PAS domain S-box-containing protein